MPSESEYSTKELKDLTIEEKQLFTSIEKENVDEAKELVRSGKVRINCLDNNGMSPLDQACFKGNEDLVEFFLGHGADADNRAHEQGYTALMFAALAGKPRICQLLLDAGANPQAVNTIGKTAGELAAFVGQHECVSVIGSHISCADVERILHPQTEASQPRYPHELVQFIHRLTRTHAFHPVRLTLDIALQAEEPLWEHRRKAVWTVDRLFERQLRSKEPNEVLSLKLWLILHTLRELLKFVEERMAKDKTASEIQKEGVQSDNEAERKLALNFARTMLNDRLEHLVRLNEELFLRQAIAAFPYKQAMVWQSLSKQLAQIPFGTPPAAFLMICQALLGPRFVQTAQFCRTCAVPSAQKRCKNCKLFYCSVECQRFDWPIHKKCCNELKKRREEQEKEEDAADGTIVIPVDGNDH